MNRNALIAVIITAAVFCSLHADVLPTAKQNVLALTGKRTKAVYLSNGTIRGFDTETGNETIIRNRGKDPGGAEGPFILPDGNRVVFWDDNVYGTPATFVINWDGTNQRTIWRSGTPAAIHLDRSTGITWVYIKDSTVAIHPIWRVQVDDTTKKELMWKGGPVGPMWFCVQTDGNTAKYKPALVNMRTGSVTDMGYTCWVGCSPDPGDANRTFVYIGDHRNILIGPNQKLVGGVDKKIQLDKNNEDSWGIRWSNDIRIVSMVMGGGTPGAVTIARFNSDFSGIEGTARITPGLYAGVPHVWLEQPCSAPPKTVVQPQSITVVENQQGALEFGISACGKHEYQWSKNSSPIPGAVSARLNLSRSALSDDGSKFTCVGKTPYGSVTSNQATLTVLADMTAPEVLSAAAISPTRIIVTFSEPIEESGAQNIANYSLKSSVTISRAALLSNKRSVELGVSELTVNRSCTLTVVNVKDRSARQNAIAAAGSKTFFRMRSILDSLPPGQPISLFVERYTATQFQFRWTNPVDQGIGLAGYWILRDGQKLSWIKTSRPEATWYADNNVVRSRQQTYEILSVDSVGNCSEPIRMLFDGTGVIPSICSSAGDVEKPPFITIVQPKAGTTVKIGDTLEVKWQLIDLKVMGEGILFSISFDDGRSWKLISEENAKILDSDNGIFKWLIPAKLDESSTVSEKCKIRIEDYSKALSPVLSGTFRIDGNVSVSRAHSLVQGNAASMMIEQGNLIVVADPNTVYMVRIYSLDGRLTSKSIIAGSGRFSLPANASVAELSEKGKGVVGVLRCMPGKAGK